MSGAEGEVRTGAREEILARLRGAVGSMPERPAEGTVPHHAEDVGYRRQGERSQAQRRDVFTDRLGDYRAQVVTCGGHTQDVQEAVARVLTEHGVRRVVAPREAAQAWLGSEDGDAREPEVIVDHAGLVATDLAEVDAVLTGCALGIAETGVIVLDGGPWSGRRLISLVPDLHVCVVGSDQLIDLPPEAIDRLDPRAPQTWIAGPSATSDIELERVEGVHGPRTLVAILAG